MPFLAASPATDVAPLAGWGPDAEVGYVVTPLGGGRPIRVTVNADDTLEVEGGGVYAIVETVRVAERRAGLR